VHRYSRRGSRTAHCAVHRRRALARCAALCTSGAAHRVLRAQAAASAHAAEASVVERKIGDETERIAVRVVGTRRTRPWIRIKGVGVLTSKMRTWRISIGEALEKARVGGRRRQKRPFCFANGLEGLANGIGSLGSRPRSDGHRRSRLFSESWRFANEVTRLSIQRRSLGRGLRGFPVEVESQNSREISLLDEATSFGSVREASESVRQASHFAPVASKSTRQASKSVREAFALVREGSRSFGKLHRSCTSLRDRYATLVPSSPSLRIWFDKRPDPFAKQIGRTNPLRAHSRSTRRGLRACCSRRRRHAGIGGRRHRGSVSVAVRLLRLLPLLTLGEAERDQIRAAREHCVRRLGPIDEPTAQLDERFRANARHVAWRHELAARLHDLTRLRRRVRSAASMPRCHRRSCRENRQPHLPSMNPQSPYPRCLRLMCRQQS